MSCPVPPASRRRFLAAAGGVLAVPLLAGLGGCGDDGAGAGLPADTPRPMTAEEADRLATVRLRMLRSSPVPVRMTWPGSPASVFDARLDLSAHVGWGTFATEEVDGSTGAATSDGAVSWDFTTVATAPESAGGGTPPVGSWTLRALSSDVPRDLFLVLSLNLGADRPENAQLLRQGSARFLRRDEVGGRAVSVLEGPQPAAAPTATATATPTPQTGASAGTGVGTAAGAGGRTRFWVADDGSLLRFEADLGLGDDRLASVDVLADDDLAPDLEATARQVLAARP